MWVYRRDSAPGHIEDSLYWWEAFCSSDLRLKSTRARRHAHCIVFDLTQQHEYIVVMGLSHALENVHGLGLRSGLHKGQQLADLVTLGFQDLIPASQSRPSAFALLSFILAIGAQILAARTCRSVVKQSAFMYSPLLGFLFCAHLTPSHCLYWLALSSTATNSRISRMTLDLLWISYVDTLSMHSRSMCAWDDHRTAFRSRANRRLLVFRLTVERPAMDVLGGTFSRLRAWKWQARGTEAARWVFCQSWVAVAVEARSACAPFRLRYLIKTSIGDSLVLI